MSKIIIVIPYFGAWPFWMRIFLASCARNPDIHWLLLGDCGEPENLPQNVIFKPVSFVDYKRRVAESLGITFDPDSAYKLCDIKPMLGKIHAEEISSYDFWGFGDLDLVYGDLRKIYTEEILAAYDLISNHATRVSGHLCLIRNTEHMREIFKKVPHWQDRIENPEHVAFDEKAFSKLFVKHKNFPGWLRAIADNFYPLVRRSQFVERYTTPGGYIAWKDGSFQFPEKWFWNNGELWNDLEPKGKEHYPYFHFLIWKKHWQGIELALTDDDSVCYEFSETGIYEKN